MLCYNDYPLEEQQPTFLGFWEHQKILKKGIMEKRFIFHLTDIVSMQQKKDLKMLLKGSTQDLSLLSFC